MNERSGFISKIENWFEERANYAKPIPTIWWILITVIAGVVLPLLFDEYTLGNTISFNLSIVLGIIFLIIEFLFIYISVWVLTYFYYRRFLKTRAGLNFFISRFFRFEQITVYVTFLICLYISIMEKDPSFIYSTGVFWISVMWPLYGLEWLFGGRRGRHNDNFYPRMGKGSDYTLYNPRRDS